jgi:signal transduction histidine kinase
VATSLSNGSFLIEQGLEKHDETFVRKGWNIVERNQGRISALVMDMLTFSKEREPDPVPSDINEVVADVVELAQSRAAELKVAIEWNPAPGIPLLTFDPEGIHRAVLNVTTNAIDACDGRPEAKVTIATQYDAAEGLVRVIVEDTGIGIAAEDLDKIFTLFVSHKGGRGTGLGLPVSQKILKEHGGEIHVTSRLGRGSRFALELPAVLPAVAVPTAAAETSSGQVQKP